ncbi:hypothetical protein ACOMHN_061770 [Nucella lapillus]
MFYFSGLWEIPAHAWFICSTNSRLVHMFYFSGLWEIPAHAWFTCSTSAGCGKSLLTPGSHVLLQRAVGNPCSRLVHMFY